MVEINNPSISSLSTRNHLDKIQDLMKSSLSKMASGKRINSGADDAAGLAVATRLNAQVAEFGQSIRTATDAISLSTTAEGGMSRISENLGRMRELAVQSANGTLNDSDRAAIQQEVDQLGQEINAISQGTEFNGETLLDGSYDETFQLGDEGIDVAIQDLQGSALGVEGIDMTSVEDALAALDTLDQAIDQVSSARGEIGAFQNRLDSAVNRMSQSMVDVAEAESRIMDTDYAKETSIQTMNQIKEQFGMAVLAQTNNLAGVNVMDLL